MSILAQCGYGRSNKIESGLADEFIEGVIMSPRDERRDRLEQAVSEWASRYPDAIVMFDPQFYAATLNEPRDGHLNEFDYYKKHSGLGRSHFSGARISKYVKDCLDYQHNTFHGNVTYILSPTIFFDSFRDSWSQIALNMAVESADYHQKLHDPQPLLVSVVMSETAFQSMDAVEEFLDAATEIDAQGFYIVVRRNAASLQNSIESAAFGRFMYFCHVLSAINEYDVVVGFADLFGFLLEAAGVTFTATGWHQNLRQFSLSRFQPATGGRRPRKRYSSAPMLSCPLLTPELQDIYLAKQLHRVLSGSKYDSIISSGPSAGESDWTDEISCLAHWFSLTSISEQIAAQSTPSGKALVAAKLMEKALALYTNLAGLGISFEPGTGPNHIREWQDSLQEYRSLAGIQ